MIYCTFDRGAVLLVVQRAPSQCKIDALARSRNNALKRLALDVDTGAPLLPHLHRWTASRANDLGSSLRCSQFAPRRRDSQISKGTPQSSGLGDWLRGQDKSYVPLADIGGAVGSHAVAPSGGQVALAGPCTFSASASVCGVLRAVHSVLTSPGRTRSHPHVLHSVQRPRSHL